jgi:hypothetical protein
MAVAVSQVGATACFEYRYSALLMGAVVDDRMDEMIAVQCDKGICLHGHFAECLVNVSLRWSRNGIGAGAGGRQGAL